MRKISLAFIVLCLLMVSFVSAELKVTNAACYPTESSFTKEIHMDRNLGVHINLISTTDIDNVDINAYISGYEYGKLQDSVPLFDMQANAEYRKKVSFTLPDDMEPGKYKVNFHVTGDGVTKSCYRTYEIMPKRVQMKINDVALSPSSTIKAGEILNIKSWVKNTGGKDQKFAKVTAQVPALSISDSKYFKETLGRDSLFFDGNLMVPECSKPGTYNIDLLVEYDRKYMDAKQQIPFTVTAGNCGEVTVNSNKVTVTSLSAQDLKGLVGGFSDDDFKKYGVDANTIKSLSEDDLKTLVANMKVEEGKLVVDKGALAKGFVSSYGKYILVGLLFFVVVLLVIIGAVMLIRR